MGSKSDDFFADSVNEQHSDTNEPLELDYANLFNHIDQPQDLTSLNLLPIPSPDLTPYDSGSFFMANPGLELSDDSDSDGVLKYISEILMEEDLDQKPCMFSGCLALQLAEQPFSDGLGTNKNPGIDGFVDSPNDRSWSSVNGFNPNPCSERPFRDGLGGTNQANPNPVIDDFVDNLKPVVHDFVDNQIDDTWNSANGLTVSAVDVTSYSLSREGDVVMQFQKGMEEASKFLPETSNIVIDLENIDFPDETEEELIHDGSVGRKIIRPREEENEFDEGGSNKQTAVSTEEAELSEMFDRILLCRSTEQKSNCTMGLNLNSVPGKDDHAVDLRMLLILCAQAVASDDRRTSDELLKQIREHSSNDGDGSQRLAHYFANALEARLSGTGAQIYTSLSSKRTTAADMIKAYQFFYCISPVERISIGFANDTILKAVENKSKLHIIDFGILYGFHWPLLIQCLSERSGGPPKLRVSGIDLPRPGFRPLERVEATGSRLANYCRKFNVAFEYHAIAQRWETIRVEDLNLENDSVVVVNCLFRFKNLLDESIIVDSPRNAVLNLVRRINPDIFLHGVVNGSYNSPFFVTRFREALFHYSTLFDVFDGNARRENPKRVLFEEELYGREIMNVVACEGIERSERPETYRQWQIRNIRAGFRQRLLDIEVSDKLRRKVIGKYHRDFVVDVDGQWILFGWKGRITHAISAWVPA